MREFLYDLFDEMGFSDALLCGVGIGTIIMFLGVIMAVCGIAICKVALSTYIIGIPVVCAMFFGILYMLAKNSKEE